MNPSDNGCSCDLNQAINLAQNVQQLLFPRSSPVCSWCCIGVKNWMAQGLGGDYFDFIEMPDGCQTLYLGDVTGHGLHASVVMSLIYGFIHRGALDQCNPLTLATGVNRFLRVFAKRSQKFDHLFSTTLFFATIEPTTLMMNYVNCGHVHPLIRRQERLLRLKTTAPPLGFFSDPEIELGSIQLLPDDRLLLYTDGINEAENPRGEQFGHARVEAALMELEGDHLEFLEAVYQRILNFNSAQPPNDDCTAIVFDIHRPMPGD